MLRSPAARTWFVAGASMAFLVAAQLESVSLEYAATAIGSLLVMTVFVFCAGARVRRNPSVLYLALAIVLPLSALLCFKYALPALRHFGIAGHVAVPMGISYYTFKHVHYLIECSRGQFAGACFREYLAFVYFFPMFAAGPIERFQNLSGQLRTLRLEWGSVSSGFERILYGLVKKFLVADLLLTPLLPELPATSLPWRQAVLVGFLRFQITYFDFSGYTDMVLGTARFFGIRLMENFNFPLLRPNLAEFWRAWHISLSSWARDYVYFPLLGRYRSTTLALLATMLMIGVWHSPAPGWAFWGLHHGLGLVCLSYYHRWAQNRVAVQELRASLPWRVGSTLVTWWYVSIGYALTFHAGEVGTSLKLYLRIVSFGVLA